MKVFNCKIPTPLCVMSGLLLYVMACVIFLTADPAGAAMVDGGKFVGNITHSGQIPSDFANYWNQITCENEGKWSSVESTRDVMNWSFQKARQYCPDATLILNDYNVLRWDTNNFISIANKVKAAGLLDAVGLQAHGLESQSFSELQQNFNRVAAIGVPIYISEYDVNIADDNQQKQVMSQQFPLFYESPSVAGITLWGYTHGQDLDSKQRPYPLWIATPGHDLAAGLFRRTAVNSRSGRQQWRLRLLN